MLPQPAHSLLILMLCHRVLLLFIPLFCACALRFVGGKGDKRSALIELVRIVCESHSKQPLTWLAKAVGNRKPSRLRQPDRDS